MKRVVLLLACLVIMPSGVQAGELFRWVDKAGQVHYGDVPPADATDVERKKLSSDVSQNEELPYETRRAQQNFPVTLYVGESCGGPCAQARSLLNKRGVPFSEKLLKTKSEIDAFQKLSGSNNSPTLLVGKTYFSGFLESAWNSELDVAGYPKTPSYRQRIAPPAPPAPITPPAEDQTAPAEPAAQ
jgi:glutaredoxin